jgi:hypothetical protein
MKTILFSLLFLVLAAAVAKFGVYLFVVGLFALLGLYGLYLSLRKKVRYIKELRWHGERKEPIFVTAKYEGDNTIYSRAKYHREMLEEAGNNNWVKEVKDGEEIKTAVPVYELIPGYPLELYAGETWEEYKDRERDEKRRLLRAFHQYTYNNGRHEWVMNQILNQKIK